MRVTTKGQVTIPLHIREQFGIHPHTEVEFVVEKGRVYLKRKVPSSVRETITQYRGCAEAKMSTAEIMALTRGSR